MTPTQTQGFAEAATQSIPSLACIGYVDEVGEGKISASGTYVVQPIKIRANDAGRNITVQLLYRPEWLDPNFLPAGLLEHDGGSSMLFVYRRNIREKGRVSVLQGLSGSDEGFARLAANIFTLPEKSIVAVQDTLRDFFVANQESGVEIAYVLKQKREKAGVDENGKQQYELAQGYEVGEFHYATPENLKRLKQRASRPTANLKITFGEE
jgi:hypothetical protein